MVKDTFCASYSIFNVILGLDLFVWMSLTRLGAPCLVIFMSDMDLLAHIFIQKFILLLYFGYFNGLLLLNVLFFFADLVNVFDVFLPQLLLYPNPSDPLNGEAAALMMRDKIAYEQRVKGWLSRIYFLNFI